MLTFALAVLARADEEDVVELFTLAECFGLGRVCAWCVVE